MLSQMKRRSFLKALFYAAMIGILSRLPGNKYGAVFQVVKIENEKTTGPRDYDVPVGTIVYNGHRCCRNCSLVFAAFKPNGDWQNGPSFVDSELKPMNSEAADILKAIRISQQGHTADFALVS
jgi:hypothetical protein